MCFTINIYTTRDAIEKRFNADASVLCDFDFRYFYRAFENPILPVITGDKPGVVQLMQWGLIPHWAGDREQADKVRRGTYNARSETLRSKPSFRGSFGKNHCLLITCGFFEWQHVNRQKIPWYVSQKNDLFMPLAGMYDIWEDKEEPEIIRSFTVVTVPANPLMERIHNTKKRMPAIMNQHAEKSWLNTDSEFEHNRLLVPLDENRLNAYTVGKSISTPGTDPRDKSVIDPLHYHIDQPLF